MGACPLPDGEGQARCLHLVMWACSFSVRELKHGPSTGVDGLSVEDLRQSLPCDAPPVPTRHSELGDGTKCAPQKTPQIVIKPLGLA